VAESLEWLPVWVATAAFLGFSSLGTDAGGFVVQGVSLVFPVSPHRVGPFSVVPLGAHGGGKSGIAFTEIFFEGVGVGGTGDIAVQVSRPSVFSYISVPFGVESGDSVVAFDTFVASSEFLAEGIDTVLGWSSAAGDSVVSWEAMASVVLESLGDGFTVPGGAGSGDLIVDHLDDVRELSFFWSLLGDGDGGNEGDGK